MAERRLWPKADMPSTSINGDGVGKVAEDGGLWLDGVLS